MDLLWKDIRFGLRTLVRNPATTGVALLALALGIGANTAIFSVVSGVLLEPLPFSEPDELVLVWETHTGRGMPRVSVSPPNFNDWRQQARSFEGLAASERAQFTLTGGERPELLAGASVSAGFFTLLGAPMVVGRDFTAEEDRPGAGRVAILSEGLWRRLFASDPQILGRTLRLSGEPYTVVGVAPAVVDLPNDSQLWVPLASEFLPEDRGAHSVRVLGRLKPGVSLERAQAEMSAIAARLERQYPENEGWGALVMPLRESLVQNIRPILLILLGAVSFVLLIACANVANLLLARVAAREREIAVRTALGAGRWRLMRQMLTESAVLFLGGGLLGLLLAYWGTRALVAMSPEGVIPRAAGIGLDGRVLLFTFGVSLLTGLLFGLVPALHATGGPLQPSLKEGGRGQSGGLRGRWVRNALVLAEVSIALMLLVGAGLLIQSFSRLRSVDPGMRTDGVLTAEIAIAETKYPEPAQQTIFFRQLLERLQAMPGVE
ncbi:MAG TPA: ABC transporter permease, partial [Thermoanaerobaculia bacterium]|nr:ABC transporter permease [Thermoanaerobaculia bacterium]